MMLPKGGLHTHTTCSDGKLTPQEVADAPLVHILEGIPPENVKTGIRVKPVFAKETTGAILDIDHFEPL
jgi:uncharacterized OB-fold protein